MSTNSMVHILAAIIALCSMGCESEPGLDKNKFLELNRIVLELKSSVSATANDSCALSEALLQQLVAKTASVKEKATSKADSDLIQAYANLIATYQDGLLLCKHMTHFNQYPFVPKGRVYVFQELDPLVEKYDLPTEKHVYQPTGVHWRSIPKTSINVIWERALVQTRYLENVLNYN